MLVQAGVEHRCAGAEDACDEEMLGSLAGGHAGKGGGEVTSNGLLVAGGEGVGLSRESQVAGKCIGV